MDNGVKTAYILFQHSILRNGSCLTIPLRSITFAVVRCILSLCVIVDVSQVTLNADDTIPTTILPDFEVTQHLSPTVRQDASGHVRLSSEATLQLGRTFGEADFLGNIKGLGGVTTAGDYASGVSVFGALPSQTLYRIDGAPVIFPYRFGGVFSTFNTTHFADMTYIPTAIPVSAPQRIGAMFDFNTLPKPGSNVSGDVNIGLLASSVTLRFTPSPRYFVIASARVSYIDQLYRGLLKKSTSYMSYRFYDINLTAGYRPTPHDALTFNLFTNHDDLSYTDRNYDLTSAMDWCNLTAGISWHHTGRTDIITRAYFAGFNTRLSLDLIGHVLKAPSRLRFGAIESILSSPLSRAFSMEYGVQMEWGETLPQYVWLNMNTGGDRSDYTTPAESPDNDDSYRYGVYRAFARMKSRLSAILTLEGGVSMGLFASRGQTHAPYNALIADPRLTLRYNPGIDCITFNMGLYSQYLHNIGFSDLGLASDFWLAACHDAAMQRALVWSARWFRPLRFAALNISIDTYFSLTFNQPEFTGNILDAIDIEYSPFMFLSRMRGFNYGISLQISRNFGRITGNITYSYGLGRTRTYELHALYHPADNDPGNTLNLTLGWNLRRWYLSSTFRYADGRRYTPIEALYIIGGNLAMKYGPRNSGRLPSYQRLDLSATYTLHTGGRLPLTHLINISFINAYGHRNTEMQYFVIDENTGDYKLKRLNSMYRFLPSISYTLRF